MWKPFVTDIDYNAKGQRERIEYRQWRQHDLRLRPADLPPDPPANTEAAASALQDLFYTYDPAGNITHIRDDAQQTIYFRNCGRRAEQRLHLRRASTG